MDNKIYLHLKDNLIKKLVGKCYKNYGYITNIYKIEQISDGLIELENTSCSSKMIVKFSCRLCYPIKNKEIICVIHRMNKALISAINGPIKAIITPDKINKDVFFIDVDRFIRTKQNSEIVVPNIYVKVIILESSFSDHDNDILTIGFLQDIATPEEIKLYDMENKNDIQESEYESNFDA
jgi:DNA-directed RNA polymerase subunit E'/Rpb7